MPGRVYGYEQNGSCIWQDNTSGTFFSSPFSQDQTGWVVEGSPEISSDQVWASRGNLPPADFFCQSTLPQRSELRGDEIFTDFDGQPTLTAFEQDSGVVGTDLLESA